jgi:hypothetical protein
VLLQSHRLVHVGALPLCVLPSLVRAQDPIVKPTPTVTTTYRLAAPATAIARQLPDGRIEVRWSRVAGAVTYRVTRSVPNLQPEQAITPDPRDTAYVDSDVKAGYSYYYVLAAVNDAGGIGLKRGAAPVNATLSAGTTTTTATPASSPLEPVEVWTRGPQQFEVRWTGTGANSYDVTRVVYRGTATDPSQMDQSTGKFEMTTNVLRDAGHRYVDSFAAADYPRWVQYRIRSHALIGPGSTASSPPQLVPAQVTTTTAPASTTGSATTPTAPASTSVPPTLQASVAVGGSSALANVTAIAGAQWLSANPSVASVSADGTVTGRAGGTTSVVAVVPQADGSFRATVVRVTVTP